jgi:diguanylate cyclase (GGDEF)-like protein
MELTGLPNRRAWNAHLDLALARSRRSGEPLSVLLLDLDGFKQVNDQQGHAAGDRLLVEVTRLAHRGARHRCARSARW